MKASSHTHANVTSTVYILNSGEIIPKHKHPLEHTTCVIDGSSEVEIWGDEPKIFKMTPGMSDYLLPAEMFHEIRALEDNTIIINIMVGGKAHVITDYPPQTEEELPQFGGVLLVDGTIIYNAT